MDDPVSVAVVGSGLSGLASAYFLASKSLRNSDGAAPVSFNVHIFEASPKFGLDNASFTIYQRPQGEPLVVDTPMRSLQTSYYSRLIRLCQDLGLELHKHNYTYSYSHVSSHSSDVQREQCYFLGSSSNSALHAPVALPSTCRSIISIMSYLLYAMMIGISYWYMLFCAIVSLYILPISWTESTSIAEWCELIHLPQSFVQDILFPLFSCVCTCSLVQLGQYPAVDILRYIVTTFRQNHVTIKGGVTALVEKLTDPIPISNRHTSSRVVKLRRSSESNRLYIGTSSGQSFEFDHVILATPPYQAAEIIKDFDGEQTEKILLLNTFPSSPSRVVNHHDSTLLPKSNTERRDLNILVPLPSSALSYSDKSDKDEKPRDDYCMATHCVHNYRCRNGKDLQGNLSIYQTTNPTRPIEASKVISTTHFTRARVTVQSRSSLRRLSDFQGFDGIWFAGAWCVSGIPLLESCIESAELVTERITEKY